MNGLDVNPEVTELLGELSIRGVALKLVGLKQRRARAGRAAAELQGAWRASGQALDF